MLWYDPEQLSSGILHFYVDGKNSFDLYKTGSGWELVNYNGGEVPQEVTSAATQLTGTTPTVSGPGSETVTKLTTPSGDDWFGSLVDPMIPNDLGGAALLFGGLFGAPLLSELGTIGGAAGIDPASAAGAMGGEVTGGLSLTDTLGGTAGGSMDLTDIIEELGNFTGGDTADGFTGSLDELFTAAEGSGSSSLASSLLKALGLGGTESTGGGLADGWLARLLGAAIPAGLGAYGASQQSDALRALAEKQMGLESDRFNTLLGREDAAIKRQQDAINWARQQGEPYRQQLSALLGNPSSFLQSEGVQSSVQQGTNALGRALSAKVGNPAGNMTAMGEMQNYATNSLYDKLGAEITRLGQLGGLTSAGSAGASVPGIQTTLSQNVQNAGSGAATGSIQSDRDVLGNLSYGLANVFNPQPQQSSLETLLRSYTGGGSGVFKGY
jgi:hypothetical protein